MTDRFKQLLILTLIVVVVTNLIAAMTWDISYISNDGVQYLSTASNWLAGLGLSTDALMYTPHFQGVFPAPQTVWPPGYPAILALAAAPGFELPVTALYLNLIFHLIAAYLVFLILRKMQVDRFFSVTCATLFYVLTMPWSFVTSLITEPLFTTLILAAVLTLPDPDRSGIFKWILCGALIAASIYVRYSAVLFAMAVGIGFTIVIFSKHRANPRQLMSHGFKLFLLTLIPVIAFAQMMYRTQELVGTLDRYSGTSEPMTLLYSLRLWIVTGAEILGFVSGGIFSIGIAKILFVIFVFLVALMLVLYLFEYKRATNNKLPDSSAAYLNIASMVIICHALCLTAYLTMNSISDSPLRIVNRYAYQIYPGLFILFGYICYRNLQAFESGGLFSTRKLSQTAMGLLIPIYLIAQVNELGGTRPLYFAEPRQAQRVVELQVTKNTTLNAFIQQCFQNKHSGSIWSTHGQHLHLHTNVPTVTHAAIYTNDGFSAQKFAQEIADYDMQVFVFIEDEKQDQPHYRQYMGELERWLLDNGYQHLPMLENTVNGGRQVTVITDGKSCA